ncbi:pilus assembly protein [Novimethylophilus kurashikiensis]|uniref:Pilus assembly protein n=1 Tax=Novimethylophilus kurashikiensis TaxID=1825523 RepID=A0A2R5F9I0_9PROT|nr:hypothetical protein [Novimethylophilus kurashikiensis]GBG14890.1 pilus assembly protein [Novimethylophilus kurashikiensis]
MTDKETFLYDKLIRRDSFDKTVIITERIVTTIHASQPVLVIDCGVNYRKLCELFGGCYIIQHEHRVATEIKYGSTPFIVYDLSNIRDPIEVLNQPELIPMPYVPDGLVVVDDALQSCAKFSLLPAIVRGYAVLGARVLISANEERDLAQFNSY